MSDETKQTHTAEAETKTFSAEYVKELRSENKQLRLKYNELETSQKATIDALTKKEQELTQTVNTLSEKVNKAKTTVRDNALAGLLKEAGITDEKQQKLLIPGLLSESKIEVSDELNVTFDKDSALALIKMFRPESKEPETKSVEGEKNVEEVKNLLKPEPKHGLITVNDSSAGFRKELQLAFSNISG